MGAFQCHRHRHHRATLGALLGLCLCTPSRPTLRCCGRPWSRLFRHYRLWLTQPTRRHWAALAREVIEYRLGVLRRLALCHLVGDDVDKGPLKTCAETRSRAAGIVLCTALKEGSDVVPLCPDTVLDILWFRKEGNTGKAERDAALERERTGRRSSTPSLTHFASSSLRKISSGARTPK